ncbi:hypothetical protein N9312_02080 [Bacteroidia bacterium]|nr:hypothetical protein [Bacteroidia bacterium]
MMQIISLAQSESKILPKIDAFLTKSDGTIKNKILESIVKYGFSLSDVEGTYKPLLFHLF